MGMLLMGRAQAVAPVPNGKSPCTLVVYWDGRVTGCEKAREDSLRSSLLGAAVENAKVSLHEWRLSRSDLGSHYGAGFSDSTATGPTSQPSTTRPPRREMERTSEIDSMAVSITIDFFDDTVAELRTRYWVARVVVNANGASRRMECVDYRESWRLAEGGWVRTYSADEGGMSWPIGGTIAASPGGQTVTLRPCECWSDAKYVTSPRPIQTVQPTYPEFAREAQIRGTVLIGACIGSDGSVCNVRVDRGVTGLNESAMEAAKKWKFEPAKDPDGKAVPVWYKVLIQFHD